MLLSKIYPLLIFVILKGVFLLFSLDFTLIRFFLLLFLFTMYL